MGAYKDVYFMACRGYKYIEKIEAALVMENKLVAAVTSILYEFY